MTVADARPFAPSAHALHTVPQTKVKNVIKFIQDKMLRKNPEMFLKDNAL